MLGGPIAGSARLLERELGVLVQVDVERFEIDRHGPSLALRAARAEGARSTDQAGCT